MASQFLSYIPYTYYLPSLCCMLWILYGASKIANVRKSLSPNVFKALSPTTGLFQYFNLIDLL